MREGVNFRSNLYDVIYEWPFIGTKNGTILTNDFKLRYSNNLDYVGALNSALTQTSDITEAIGATLSKQKPIFPKL